MIKMLRVRLLNRNLGHIILLMNTQRISCSF
nr:MAG TPA: hypothetical protein [Bacteriophage sp.]